MGQFPLIKAENKEEKHPNKVNNPCPSSIAEKEDTHNKQNKAQKLNSP